MPATLATPRRMANAVATASVLLAVHRTTDIPVRYSAFPEARSLPEGPMRGLTAIARRFLSLSFLFLFFYLVYFSLSLALFHPRSFKERERESEEEREGSQGHALCTQIIYICIFIYIYYSRGPRTFFSVRFLKYTTPYVFCASVQNVK